MIDTELRLTWNKLIHFNWIFGLILLLTVCVPRFWMVLHANQTGNYGNIGIIMAISALIPFIFLSKDGRKQIGITKPKNYSWIVYSFLSGIAISTLIFVLGYLLYTNSLDNWYVYIGKSYNIGTDLTIQDRLIYFIIFAVTGMCFSPIGEELFFRGIVHASFSSSLGERKATIIDSLAFALTHLAHFGIVYIYGSWGFLFIPSILWVLAMFITSLVFIQCKKMTGSIIGAIASHAGFNVSMIYFIFYQL
ncbi:CPBP family intramembrane glutamic endopeptidase [Adhaeribacter aquaticus]|uniref:CPBP family intramembrane glutamic endopeptidase n=1 Tax=Adhaeribacter aquaticus TaxID=299567 RepID=UPI00054E7D74|nr:CPBP family glutamic-type intramembrane protease [Adhaeribacter aquaticus]